MFIENCTHSWLVTLLERITFRDNPNSANASWVSRPRHAEDLLVCQIVTCVQDCPVMGHAISGDPTSNGVRETYKMIVRGSVM